MKMTTGGLLILATVLATGATDLTAQRGQRGPQMRGGQGRQERGVESIMRLRESLELTEDQVSQLDAIRRENVQRRTAEMAQQTEIQSQYAAGLIRRSDVMAATEDRQDAAREEQGQQRERLQSILTEAQQESLNGLRRQDRASAGPGFRSGRPGHQGRGVSRGNRGGQQGRGAFRGNRGGQQGRGAFRNNRGGQQGRRSFRGNRGG